MKTTKDKKLNKFRYSIVLSNQREVVKVLYSSTDREEAYKVFDNLKLYNLPVNFDKPIYLVMITECSVKTYWYVNKIGAIYYVVDSGKDDYYRVLNNSTKNTIRLINKEDAVVLNNCLFNFKKEN
jgi:hypothetical protein